MDLAVLQKMENRSCKTRCKNFASEATLHGPQRISMSKNWLIRTTWTIIFLGFVSSMIYFLSETFESFLSHSVYTTIEKKLPSTMQMTFPSVTICSTGLFRKSMMNSNNSLLYKYFSNQTKVGNLHLDGIRLENAIWSQHMYFNNLKDFKKGAIDGSDLFLKKIDGSCVFGIKSLCKYPRDFKRVPISSFEGYCYTFNPNGTYKQKAEGSYFGLSMMIFINQSDNAPFLSVDQGGGASVVIHPQDQFPFPIENGILLKPGTLTRISIRKTVTKRKPAPYPSKCTNGEGIKLIYPGRYTRTNCKRSCFTLESYKECGSQNYIEAKYSNVNSKILNESEISCLLKSIGTTMNKVHRCNCPVSCEEENYSSQQSHTTWPAVTDFPYYRKAFAAALQLNESDLSSEFVYKNFLKLNVFFDDLSYDEVTENAEWTYQKLLSDIGGQTGIWIGASAFSLIEIVAFLLQLIKSCFIKNSDRLTTASKTQVSTNF